MRSPSRPKILLAVNIHHIRAVALHELLIDHLICALDRVIGLFNLDNIHIRRCLAAEGERNHLAVQTQQAAAQIQIIEVVESLYDRTGFPFEIALMSAAVQVAPVDMERKKRP